MTAEEPATTPPPTEGLFDDLWTIPNAFTLVRLLCLPLFLYLLFGLEERAAAALLLGALGATDWVDGYLARRLGQVSEFGKIFDPTVDRLQVSEHGLGLELARVIPLHQLGIPGSWVAFAS